MASGKQVDKRKDLSTSTSHGERQRPLSSHRRLRHLHGITIRNLTLTDESSRPRAQTIDDEAIPSTLKSPTKLENPKFASRLGHANSSLNLKEVGRVEAGSGDASYHTNPPRRLLQGQLKRRITSEWSGASPPDRQRKLEDVIGTRMLDTFFSLHVVDVEEPIYISEVAEKTTNPDFRFFDITSQPASVTRRDNLVVRIWTKHERHDDYQYAIEERVNLASLRYVGKGLEPYRHALPNNCVFFHLSDGLYTSHKDTTTADTMGSVSSLAPYKSNQFLLSSSYDSLLKLSALDDCIQDALSTRNKLADDIDRVLAKHSKAFGKSVRRPEAYEAVEATESAVAVQRRRLQKAAKRRGELTTQLRMRRTALDNGHEIRKKEESNLHDARHCLSQRKLELAQLRHHISGQRRRVCFDLADIYPIDPIPEKSFAFTIRGLALPKASFAGFSSTHEDTVIAAALGHVVQVISLLSLYLSALLPYPISSLCSTSSIVDAPAMTAGIRAYPLFPRSGPRFRFEYGVFLLNKDIEILTARLDAKVLDIRHTLANLKFVLYLATAGEGELPARKAGGLKGLLLRRYLVMAASESGSRPGSGSTLVTGSPADLHRAQTLSSEQGLGIANDESSSDAGSERNSSLSMGIDGDPASKANGKACGARQSGSRAEKGSDVNKALKGTIRAQANIVGNHST